MGFERFDAEEFGKPKESTPEEKASAIVNAVVRGPANYRNGKTLLPGVHSSDMDSVIRHIVAERFSDKNDTDISRELGYADEYVKTLEKRKPEAFEEARRLHINTVVDKHAMRMAQVTCFLSDAAIDAVKCLRDILNDTEARETTRRQAAVDVLNLFYLGRTKGKGGGNDGVNSGVAVLIQNINPSTGAKVGSDYLEIIEDSEESDV